MPRDSNIHEHEIQKLHFTTNIYGDFIRDCGTEVVSNHLIHGIGIAFVLLSDRTQSDY